ncbi:putative transcriptional regulatory protein TcrX [Rubripirellula lacrimiformis]|uniref:Putative transcriptional regulatory protein TcrX n=1 Tax=Rubripirellula lacrimiformis TaxID=1930273 RepID=A0A517NKK1_9BACT|nr:response regulator [Rubripirellula lacrimiformis]QDT07668.1 putative transcriptional regulatory protein TcrX [Rubripirellula lacrimiformis]
MFNSSGIKLLLVLAEPVLANLTSFRLELLGYQVETVASGTDASQSISKDVPDLVIVDTSLRDGDGLEWVARIRTEHAAADLPVIVFSLDTNLETVERAHHAGAQDYLISPFDPMVMESKIEKLLVGNVGKRRKRPTAQGAAI